ncbi:hypothetical protein BJY04DRAFT_177351 [Aspergillus karnatakaensis]|uniref:uncharacterized protein n=1 Tax=Aspergillus karnatakaensis TaxID=1810916 RepID=UPI003CCCBA6E
MPDLQAQSASAVSRPGSLCTCMLIVSPLFSTLHSGCYSNLALVRRGRDRIAAISVSACATLFVLDAVGNQTGPRL